MKKFSVLSILSILVVAFLISCSVLGIKEKISNPEIILATTTSTYDSALLDDLIPVFEAESGYTVKIVSVGTGQALTMGQQGNADILLVHSPSSEVEFMDEGYGIERALVMHNDFIIVGPKDDPAKIGDLESPVDALKSISDSQAIFISRGDDSGTHKIELSFWKQVGTSPEGEWYLESGQGMGATLKIASEKKAYTITDRATFLSLSKDLDIDILMEGHPSLLNIYHVIIVNPERWPKINLEGARDLAAFLVSAEGQKIIGEFGVDKYGQPLFFPDADKSDADFGL